jgi:hypothetical protein
MPRRLSLVDLGLLALCLALAIVCVSLLDERRADRLAFAAAKPIVRSEAPEAYAPKELRELLEMLPPGNRLLSVKAISFGDGGRYFLATSPVDADGFGLVSRLDLWLVTAERSGLEAPIASYPMQAVYFSDIEWRWMDRPMAGGDTNSPDLLVSMFSTGEGPFAWSEMRDVLMDDDGEVRASFSRVGPYFSIGSVEVAGKTYPVELMAASNCEKDYKDAATGIRFGDQEIRFARSWAVACPMFGEGGPSPTKPGLSYAFQDGDTLRISMEEGPYVDLDVRRGEFGSPYLAKPVRLQAN